LGDGPPCFPRDFSCPAVLGNCFQEDQIHLSYGTITLFGCPFQEPSDMNRFGNFPGYTLKQPHNPDEISFSGLGSSPFARHYLGNLYLISLPGGTEMFHFPPFASHTYEFSMG
jgi:hypothetical protein